MAPKESQQASFPPGLINTSNTCFVNSVMQCFIASAILQATVENARTMLPSSIHPTRSPALTDVQGMAALPECKDCMPISDAYLDFLEKSWKVRESGEKRSLSSKDVLTRLGVKYDQYLDFRQQDAHELYCHLLDAMHMEEYDIIKKLQPPPPKPNRKTRRDMQPFSGSRHPLSRTVSAEMISSLPTSIPEEEKLRPFVDQVFGGTLASMVVCESCKHVSHTYEDFTDISLSIKGDEAKLRKRDRLKSISQLFRLPARPAHRAPSAPREDFREGRDLPDTEDNPAGEESRDFFVDGVDMVPVLPVDRPMNGLLLGGSNGDGKPERRLSKRISLRWGKGRPKKDEGEKDPEKTTVHASDSEAKAGYESSRESAHESDTDWDHIRKSVEMKKHSTAPPESGHTTDASEGHADWIGRKVSLRRPAAVRAHSKAKASYSSTIKPIKRIPNEAAYIQRILADTAPVVPAPQGSPLSLLRVSNPAGASSSSGGQAQTSWLKFGGPGHGLVDCLRQFTSVEVLEGDNAFACRRCWKIANAAPGKRRSDERSDDDDSDGEDAQEEAADDVVVVSQPATSPAMLTDEMRRGSDDAMLFVPSRPPSVASASAISMAGSGDDLAASIVSSPSTFPSQHTLTVDPLAIDRSRSPSPGSDIPGGFFIPRISTTSPTHSVSPTITDPSTPQPMGSQNPFLVPGFSGHGNRRHRQASPFQPSPLSDAESGLTSTEEEDMESESGAPSAPASEAGSRPASPPLPPPALLKPAIPRSQQVIHRRALKRYLFATTPPVLVVHLKRFEQLSKTPTPFFGNLKKIEDFVSFPEWLDMSPFMAPRREDYGLRRTRGRQQRLSPPRREEEPLMYRLYGVVVHIGSMLGGHYIAYTALPSPDIRSNAPSPLSELAPNSSAASNHSAASKKSDRQWCYISDTTVRIASIEEVLKAKAYLCFYERIYN